MKRIIAILLVILAAVDPSLPAFAGEVAPPPPPDAAPGLSVVCPPAVLVHGKGSLKLQLENASAAAAAGTIELKLPAGWTCEPLSAPFSLQTGRPDAPARAEIQFTITTPASDPPGRYELTAVVDDKAAMKQYGPFTVKLTSALGDFAGVDLAEIHSSAPSMAVPIRNMLAAKLTARVGLTAADWTMTPDCIPVELEPGESRLLRFVIDGRLPVVGSLPVTMRIVLPDQVIKVRRTVDISRYRVHGWAIGRPAVQALRYDGRTITYSLPNMTAASVRIYDAKGSIMRVLDSGWQAAGPHSYEWMPDRDADEFEEWAVHTIEVRAGLDLVLERQIGPAEGTIFFPQTVAVDGAGTIHVFEGVRTIRYAASGQYLGGDVPGGGYVAIAPVGGTPAAASGARFAALARDRLLLLDRLGRMVKAIPQEDGGTGQPGHLRDPSALAVSRDGLIYVADTGNHRIQRFTMNLEPAPFQQGKTNCLGKIDAAGAPVAGAGNGEFTAPRMIALSARGHIYVCDSTGRLQKFGPAGTHVQSVRLQCTDITALAVAADGAIFLSRAGSAGITKLDSNGNPLWPGGSVETPCITVSGLAIDASGRLLACGQGPGRVLIVDPASGRVEGILGPDAPVGSIASPAGLDADDHGNLCVADLRSRQVIRITSGANIAWAAPDTRMPIRIYRPIDVAIGGGAVYVLDEPPLVDKSIVMLDLLGQPKFGFAGSYVLQKDELRKATTVELNESGNIWAGSGDRGALFDSSTGNFLIRNVPRPNTKACAGGISYQPWEEEGARGIIIKGAKNSEITRKGALGTGDGEFAGCDPGGLAAATGPPGKPDYLFYADLHNHRISVLRVDWASMAAISTGK